MTDGTVVSRSELFGLGDNAASIDNPAEIYSNFAFEEVSFDQPAGSVEDHSQSHFSELEAVDDDAPALEFQLFAGAQPMSVNLFSKPQEIHQSRPADYYFSHPSDAQRREFRLSAVTGDFVKDEAKFWAQLASKNPIADDINKDYIPKRRKCRPGKQARLNKKARNERLEQKRKEEQHRFRFGRRGAPFKPRRK